MAYLSVNKDGSEVISENKPTRNLKSSNWPSREKGIWESEGTVEGESYDATIEITQGTIEKILGRKLSWEDEPVEF